MKIEPDAAGMSEVRLERITDHFSSTYVEPGKIAGCQITVVRGGHVAYHRSLGLMDREQQTPMADDAIFRIYSMTKPIASVALMQLYERGLFQLLDPVHRYIPAWRTQQVGVVGDDEAVTLVKPERPMNMRDVLMHTSGLPGGIFADNPIDAAFNEARAAQPGPRTLETVTALLAEHPLKFHPGTHWNYGISTDIVGRLVEILSGLPLDEYLRRELFEPLDMADTGFFVPEGSLPRLAACYQYRPANTPRLMEGPFVNGILRPRSYLSGAGGLVSTTHDYVAFCQMLANGGQLDGRRVLGRKTLELMTVNHLPGGATLQEMAVGGFGEANFEGVGLRVGLRRRDGPRRHGHGGIGRRVLLGRGGQHGVLGRPGRGPFRGLHDAALPLRRLPVPGPAAGPRLPGHRRLMAEAEGPVGPLDATIVPRFAGLATFARLPTADQVARWDIAVVGVPFDGGTSYRPGARFGPAAVRQGSRLLRPYNPELATLPFETAQVVDAGDIACTPFSAEEAVVQIESEADALLQHGGRLVAIGGDHTIALPLLRATARRHGPLALVHFDAHLDTWDTYFGQRYTHGTPFRRAWEEGLLLHDHSIHVGLRGPLYSDADLPDDASMGFAQVTTDDVAERGVADVVHRVLERVGEAPLYVSVDIDVLDPAHAPGTGTPEAGGLTSRELLALVRGLRPAAVVGGDVVEVSPAYDHAEVTAIAAAHVLYDLVTIMAAPGTS